MKAKKTHCINGHQYDERNTLFLKTGYKICKKCRSINVQKFFKNNPEKYREWYKNAYEHWRLHSLLDGCSHAL